MNIVTRLGVILLLFATIILLIHPDSVEIMKAGYLAFVVGALFFLFGEDK